MEQRIGSSSQPLEGAGFDPAFIPGLTSPASGREEDAKAESEKPEDTEDPEETASSEAEPTEPAQEAEETQEAVPDGPVFEASDRRAAMVADHGGVRLRLDDQECEFRWDEIAAVETETARFGKRWTVTVHTPDRRWYYLEIEAPSRSRFEQWDAGLDAVLDEYFEDDGGGTSAEAAESAGASAAGKTTDAPEAAAGATDGTGTEAAAGDDAERK
ncbi:hypothetical protein ACF1AE_28705 [Streptomyces sp. NPDC014986]|uniref:hypothetical protein n=1 Tax=Streptomyces sp. NPDC014986 TaxID=3364934 RepID=UPI0036F8B1E9